MSDEWGSCGSSCRRISIMSAMRDSNSDSRLWVESLPACEEGATVPLLSPLEPFRGVSNFLLSEYGTIVFGERAFKTWGVSSRLWSLIFMGSGALRCRFWEMGGVTGVRVELACCCCSEGLPKFLRALEWETSVFLRSLRLSDLSGKDNIPPAGEELCNTAGVGVG